MPENTAGRQQNAAARRLSVTEMDGFALMEQKLPTARLDATPDLA
jgi:hypothetical protein